MKILFICGSLEEGKDGIGDYTRKLSRECALHGATCMLVAVNDGCISQMEIGVIDSIPFYRMPKNLSWNERGNELIKILNANSPFDWISIQFVSYGFNPKGIIWKQIPFFSLIKNWNIHIMMHELWVAEEREASVKMKILRVIQKWSIVSLIKTIKPKVVQTSIPLYKKILSLSGITSTVLPLFSNINYSADVKTDFDNKIPQSILVDKDKYLVGCVFGSIYYESWDLSSLFTILRRQKEQSGKAIMIVSIGRIGFGEEFWNSLKLKYPDISFITLGPQNEAFITYWLNNFVDFGIITTPAIIAGKSGSCMAFLEHGIPVLCKENTLSFNFDISDDLIDKRVIQISETTDFKLPERTSPLMQIKSTAQNFIKKLNTYQ